VNLSVIKDNIKLQDIDLDNVVTENGGNDISFFIGREKSCRVFLDDMRVSREHAKLKFYQKSWWIEKTNTESLITVNGNSVESYCLSSGDIVGVGPFTLNFLGLSQSQENDESIKGEKEGAGVLNEANLDEDSFDNSEKEDVTIGLGEEATEMHEERSDDYSDEDCFDSEQSADNSFDDNYEDDESFDENFPLESVEDYDEDDGTKVLQNFSNYYFDIVGEFAPYDRYELKDSEVTIGRDPEQCGIVLNDPEVSATHASLIKKAVNCSLKDLNSGNGTLLNGERVNQSELKSGDEFIIGSTTFTVRVSSRFLEQEKERMMPVEENQVAIVEEIVEVGADYDGEIDLVDSDVGEIGASNDSLFSKDALKDPEKRKKLLVGAVVLLGLWTFLDDGKKKPRPVSQTKKEKKAVVNDVNASAIKKLTPEEREIVDAHYILVTQYYSEGNFSEAIMEADKIYAITPTYKNLNQYIALAKEGVKKLEKNEQERREKERERLRKIKIKGLVNKAEKAVNDKSMDLAEGILDEVVSIDPNNDDVQRLRREISFYRKEQDRIAVEKAQKEAERKRQVQALSPGKTYYLQREWFKAISKLSDFLRSKSIDEDLRKEASDMLNTSKNKLRNKVSPLVGKARSLKEGQDLKGAYEVYLDVLNIEPSHEEALNELSNIREKLENQSKKAYREAIIAESLSLYTDAKEKFQEVQQISPVDSAYYKKATEKLKDYLD